MKKILFILLFGTFQLLGYAQWNTERILTIGRNALYFEDYVLSIQYFNQVIKIKPYLAEPYMYRAMAKVQLGDDQGAELDATEAIERNPFLPEAYYIRGFARRRLKLYKEAVNDFSKAYEFSPTSLNLLMNRMDALVKLEDYPGALQDLETYMKLNPKSTNMYYDKGFIQLQMKDTLGAELSYEKYIKVDSTNSLGWSARGLLRMIQKRDKEAYIDYSQAIKNGSTNVGDYINRGVLNVQKKNFREALTDYDNAIRLDKKNNLAYYNRALLRANLGDNNNALADLEKVVELDTTNYEALLMKASLEVSLGMYKKAIADYNTIIKEYPYFIPAFEGIAMCYNELGDIKNAFRYNQMAYNIEQNKEKIKQKVQKELAAKNKIDENAPKSAVDKKTEMFNRYATQNIDDTQSESKYKDSKRGNVQDNYTDVVNQRSFVLSYYAKTDEIRRTNLYQPIIEDYNKKKILASTLKITNNEIPLTSELINTHFDAINTISTQISLNENNADLYFKRAIEFALVQDFSSSVEDLNRALAIRPDFSLAYFCRANIRYKLVDYLKNTNTDVNVNLENQSDKIKRMSVEKQTRFDVEMIMRDYDKVVELEPDFAFAYYNKANILCTQKDYKSAISNYSKAIECDSEFAEAYFNRGLTYLFIGQQDKGLADLSKAGELGIYQSYNLLQRFSK